MVLTAKLEKIFWICLFAALILVFIGQNVKVCEDSKCHYEIPSKDLYTVVTKNPKTPNSTTNFDEANKFCAMENKILPLPRSNYEEMELVSKFKSMNVSSQCKMFYLGYKQTDMRYESALRDFTWPSLSISLSVSQPSLDRDCWEFTFQPRKTVSLQHCRDVMSTCYIFLPNRNCLSSSTKCGKLFLFKNEIDIMAAFEIIKKMVPGAIGIAVIDIDYYPLSQFLNQNVLRLKTCVALAVRYRFRYSAPDGSIMPYKSRRFIGNDVETDCLVVKLGRKTTVHAKSCNEDACILCTAIKQ